MLVLNNSQRFDYSLARQIGSQEWERVVDDEGPYAEDGTMGSPDMFKLEFTGWTRNIEFKPK